MTTSSPTYPTLTHTLTQDRLAPLDEARVYRVPTSQMPELEAKLARLVRRAGKLGCPAPSIAVVGHDKDPICNEEGKRIGWREITLVTAHGQAPKYAGWTFAARLERLAEGANVLHKFVDAVELPETYRTAPPACEHCKLRRARKDTFVVVHEDGRFAQVGSSCIADFLGHPDPESIIAWCAILVSLASACEDEERVGSREPDAYDLTSYLAWVSAAIRQAGWLSRGAAYERGAHGQATADVAWTWMGMRPSDLAKNKVEPPNELDVQRAHGAIAWAKTAEPKSDYMHNVRTIALAEIVSARSMGIAASILPAWDRELAREAERKARAARPVLDEHVGTVGERLRDLRLECVLCRDIASDFGEKHLIAFEDSEGRRYKWWSTSGRLDVGTIYNVTGTVKKHEEYKGRKETTLSRCDAATDDEKLEREAAAEKAREEVEAKKATWKLLKKEMLASGDWIEVRVSEIKPGMRLASNLRGTEEASPAAGPVRETFHIDEGKVQIVQPYHYGAGKEEKTYKGTQKLLVVAEKTEVTTPSS